MPDRVAGGIDDDERQQRKHKLLLGLNSSRNHQYYPIPSAPSYGSDSSSDDEDPEASLKQCKLTNLRPGSNKMGEEVSKATDTPHGSTVESAPTRPLPDKRLLVLILDRLQKKDTYGVFSEPVDLKELPDCHDIISNPMDFLTVRKKLDFGAYTTLEQFEVCFARLHFANTDKMFICLSTLVPGGQDKLLKLFDCIIFDENVFLICSNAMQCNAPDTIYFRQARSMQELAKKDFGNLRQDSDEGKPQPKVMRRGRPSGKSLKKSLESSSFDRIGSEFSSDATLAIRPDASSLSNTCNLRKETGLQMLNPADTLTRPFWGSHSKENYASWSSEWENEFPASVVKAVMKYGKKHFAVDENKRDTYNHSLTSGHEEPIFFTLDGELKQIIPMCFMCVALSVENGYATSLACFAADLGPVVWKIASRKMESVLPSGLMFGPGCVGESRTIEKKQFSFSEKQRSISISDSRSSILLSPATSDSNSITASRFPLQCIEDTETVRGLTSQNDSTSAPSHQFQQRALLHSGINAVGGFGIGYAPQTGMVSQPINSLSEKTSVPSQIRGMVLASDSSSTMCSMPASNFLPEETKFADSSIALRSGNAMAVGADLVSHAATNVGSHDQKSYNKRYTSISSRS